MVMIPATRVGRRLLDSLATDTVVSAFRTLRDHPSSVALSHEALRILARRRFLPDWETVTVAGYVQGVLGVPPESDRARVGVALIESALMPGRSIARVPLRHGHVIWWLLEDLIRSLDPDGRPETICAAELRLRRALNNLGRQRWQAYRYRSFLNEMRESPVSMASALVTQTGRAIEDLLLHGADGRERPREADGDREARVVDGVFAALVRRCQPTVLDRVLIRVVTDRAATRSRSPLVTGDVFVELLTKPAIEVELSSDFVLQAKLIAMLELSDLAGLFPTEIHDLIGRAES